MSSSPQREPLSGILRQGKKIVGGVCLPEHDIQSFIDQFNHCYGPMGLKIDQPAFVNGPPGSRHLIPVGAGHYNPFKDRSGSNANPVKSDNS